MVLWWSWIYERDSEGRRNYVPPNQNIWFAGYNRVRNSLIARLRRTGLLVQDGGPPPEGCDFIQIAHSPIFSHPRFRSVWNREPTATATVLFTTWEADRVPSRWVAECNEFDAVWTTSEYVAEAMRLCGVTKPIFVIHHGVEPGQFPILRRPAGRRGGAFTYLWQGTAPGDLRPLSFGEPVPSDDARECDPDPLAWKPDERWWLKIGHDPMSPAAVQARQVRSTLGDRKMSILVREAFLRLRSSGDIPPASRLVLKWSTLTTQRWDCGNYPLDGYDPCPDDPPENRRRLRSAVSVDTYGDNLTTEDMLALLYNADCSVNPFRCEGFGMIPLEHMATGLPTILTAYSGPTDYMWKRRTVPPMRSIRFMPPFVWPLGFPLAWELNTAWLEQRTRWGGNIPTAYLKQQDDHDMLEMLGEDQRFGSDAWPDFSHLMELMAWCYHNRKQAMEKAAEDARYVHAHWTWERPLQQILAACEKMGWPLDWTNKPAVERRSSVIFRNRHLLDVGDAP